MRHTPAWLAAAIERARAEGRVSETGPVRLPGCEFSHPPAAGLTEAEFQARVVALARTRGWRVAHFRPAAVVRKDGTVTYRTAVAADGKGFPDLTLVRDRVVFAELKVKTGLSDEQDAWVTALKAAGAEVRVWRPADWADILEALA